MWGYDDQVTAQPEKARGGFLGAVQAAEILLVMRPEGEVPSDFQEYTLVALVGVAVTLANTSADANAVLENLVGRPSSRPFNGIAGTSHLRSPSARPTRNSPRLLPQRLAP